MNIDNFQNICYAERYIEAGTTPSFPIATPAEMEAAYINAENRDGVVALVRGFLYELNFVPSTDHLNCTSPLAFRLDPAGWLNWVVPVYDSNGQVVDLVAGAGFDDSGRIRDGKATDFYQMSGRGALIGADELAKPWSAANPCPVFYDVDGGWLESQAGVVVLKRSAKELLTLAAHCRLNNWYDAADLASEWFEDEPERVSGPQDREAYEGYLERRARDEIASAKPSTIAESWARFNAELARKDAAREEGAIRRPPNKWTKRDKAKRRSTEIIGCDWRAS